VNPLTWLTAIFYAISRGITRGILDEMAEVSTVTKETITNEDNDVRARFRAAVNGVLSPAPSRSPGGPVDPASAIPGHEPAPPASTT
jgi:hypothetical protein